MAKFFPVVGLVVMFGVGGVFGQEDAAPVSNVSDVYRIHVIGTNSVDIGNIRNYMVTNVSFQVVNHVGATVNVVKLVPTCSCLSGTMAAKKILPNARAVINVRMDPKTVEGKFDRSLWVYTDETNTPYLSLALRGTVVPLFTGLSRDFIVLKLAQPGLSVTNHFSLEATEAAISLGTPEIVKEGNINVDVNVVTNKKEKASYEITTITTPLSLGNQSAVVQLPVLGQPLASPLVIRIQTVVGGELVVMPNQIGLASGASKPQTFRLTMKGNVAKMDPAQLAWEPKQEGVKVTSSAGARGNTLQVSVEVSPKAAEALLQGTGPSIHLTYPNHKPTNVFFVSQAQAGNEKSTRGPRGGGAPQGTLEKRVLRGGFWQKSSRYGRFS
jgi:hypothetical protein